MCCDSGCAWLGTALHEQMTTVWVSANIAATQNHQFSYSHSLLDTLKLPPVTVDLFWCGKMSAPTSVSPSLLGLKTVAT